MTFEGRNLATAAAGFPQAPAEDYLDRYLKPIEAVSSSVTLAHIDWDIAVDA